jgi:hypothetical protein
MTFVYIHAPRQLEEFCAVNFCPTCERPRRMYGRFVEWYGVDLICAGCGDEWHAGERAERPFAPGWRRRAIKHARERLAAIGVQA